MKSGTNVLGLQGNHLERVVGKHGGYVEHVEAQKGRNDTLVAGAAWQGDDEVVHHRQHIIDHLGTALPDGFHEKLEQHQRTQKDVRVQTANQTKRGRKKCNTMQNNLSMGN